MGKNPAGYGTLSRPMSNCLGAEAFVDRREDGVLEWNHSGNDRAIGHDVHPIVFVHPAPARQQVAVITHDPDHQDRNDQGQVGPDDGQLGYRSTHLDGVENGAQDCHYCFQQDGHHDE